nr:DUF4244 domain-containing protein [Streptomyces antibioticus]
MYKVVLARLRAARKDTGMVTSEYAMGIVVILGLLMISGT